MRDTLMLSRGYEPIAKVTWQRAITLLYSNKAEVVDVYSEWTVHSASMEFQVPSVIRNLEGVRRRHKDLRLSRKNIYARDNGQCQYCGKNVPENEFTYDHVIPRTQGGQSTWRNLVVCCVPCNQWKGGRTPAQAKMKLRSLPVKPKVLPELMQCTFFYEPGMPEAWKAWIRSTEYWNTPLDK